MEDDEAAQAVDFAFMSELVEASGNVVFVLILNSIRQLYFERAELFRAVVHDRGELAPLYRRAAAAVPQARARRAAAAVGAGGAPGGAAVVKLATLSRREASIFACVCDTVVAPEPLLPPVRETDAVQFLDRWLAAAPRLNRIGLRALSRGGASLRARSAAGAGCAS